MKKLLLALGVAASAVSAGLAQTPPTPAPSPGEIVAAAPASDWTAIAASDLLVMDLAPGPRGARRVVIQLMPAPFSQGWIGNIRKLAAAKWWDGTSVNRVQDNYVVQWGDATEKKALPEGLETVKVDHYINPIGFVMLAIRNSPISPELDVTPIKGLDIYSAQTGFFQGWPVALSTAWPLKTKEVIRAAEKRKLSTWPVHCYGMVGVGRNLSPDTGSGAELYTVIGHAPRHLDRNIALAGRVIEGIEHLSSLPRGTGALGFYEKEEERVPILSVRIGTEISDVPAFEYLSTDSATFAKYADARANRRDPFFNVPAGGADICNIPVPVRRKAVP